MADKIYVDKAKIIRGKPFAINDFITIYQHSIGEITEYGEKEFYSTFHTMCSAPWDIPAMLDDMGVYFMDINEWELFVMFHSIYTQKATSMLLGDLDISKFVPMAREKEFPEGADVEMLNEKDRYEIVLQDEEGHIIDENIYHTLVAYISEIINFQHKNKRPGNKTTANILIDTDRREQKRKAAKDEPFESFIYDSVISLVNTEELSYTYETIFDLTLYQFTKSLIQIQGKKSAMALLQGSMSGFCDTSKVPKEDMQWMYSDDKYKPHGKKLINQSVKK